MTRSDLLLGVLDHSGSLFLLCPRARIFSRRKEPMRLSELTDCQACNHISLLHLTCLREPLTKRSLRWH